MALNIADCALRKVFEVRTDLFGIKSSYLRFEVDVTYSGSNGLKSNWQFGRIVYKSEDNTVHLSAPLALKLSPKIYFSPMLQAWEFTNEIFFYTQILPFFSSFRDISPSFPNFYQSELSINVNKTEVALIFENLQALGYNHANTKLFLDYDHLALMMKKLGQFHAFSYKAKKTNCLQFYTLASMFRETHFAKDWTIRYLMPAFGLKGLEKFRGDPSYSSKASELEKLVKIANEFVLNVFNDEQNPVAVLCHGDYLQHNVLFKYDKEYPVDLKIIDLGSCKLSSPVVDLAQPLYINADQRMRDEHWDDLINEYYQALKETFPDNEVPSKSTIMNEFKTKVFFAYIFGSFFVDRQIALMRDLPIFVDLIPEKYKGKSWQEIPSEVMLQCISKCSNDEADEVVANILRDMIKRGFL